MKEWNNGSMEDLKKSLIDFVRKYKNSNYRRNRLLEDLEYVIHQMYAIPGPVYDRVGGTTNVKPDRMIMLIDGCESIRDVIAFPKVQNASELMSGAPDVVEVKQLDELGIAIINQE